MKIGIISDSHDNLAAIRGALAFLEAEKIDTILHAGDFVAPFALKLLVNSGRRIIAVLGNNDGEKAGLRKLLPSLGEGPISFGLAGRKFVMTHDEAMLTEVERAAANFVVLGHTHEAKIERGRGQLVINPGELGGWLTGKSTLAVLEVEKAEADIITL